MFIVFFQLNFYERSCALHRANAVRLKRTKSLAFAEDFMMNMNSMMDMSGMMLVWFLGWFGGVVFLIVAIVAAIWWFRRSQAETPLMILERRYAKGELSPEQFASMKQHLIEKRS
jgi:uncharacterized membrane protein